MFLRYYDGKDHYNFLYFFKDIVVWFNFGLKIYNLSGYKNELTFSPCKYYMWFELLDSLLIFKYS
jgi:hypothetical protein